MIIVTGANGFIGSAMVWELNQTGQNDILCVDTVSQGERPEPLRNRQFKKFLLKDEVWDFLATNQAGAQVEAILHIGACSSTTEMNVEFLTENNVHYSQRLWEWCTRNKTKFIYASSAAVYGDGLKGFDDASSPEIFQPLNPYGESKAAFDRWVVKQAACPPLWVGLRYFNVYGPNEYHKGFQSSVVCKAYDEITTSGKLKLFKSHRPDYRDGEQLRDFVYVKDVTRWMREILQQPRFSSGIYNMGFGKARTWLDLANAAFAALGKTPNIDWIAIPELIRDRYQYFTEAKMKRLMAPELGLSQPQWSLEAGVADYVKNYLVRDAVNKSYL